MFADMPGTVICGQRGELSFMNATRVGSNGDYTCPDGLQACSTSEVAGDATYCVSDLSQCPLTHVMIVEANGPIVSKSGFENVKAPSGTIDRYINYSRNGGESNSPITDLSWQLGSPCVNTDQRNMLESKADFWPIYHQLETSLWS